MSGSMSRGWKRTVWQAPQASRTIPRHLLTLLVAAAADVDQTRSLWSLRQRAALGKTRHSSY
jgi:hypothetical protein